MEVGIVLVGLGAMYILSNQNQQKSNVNVKHYYQKKEGFSGNHRSRLANPPVNNYPVEEKGQVKKSTLYYSGASNDTEMPQTNMNIGSTLNENQADQFESLTGERMRPGDIKHNNMQPFFGSSITQSTKGYEGVLDNYTGAGSQNIEKKAQAPMFKPQKDMQWQNGMPSTTDYMQERMRNNVTSKMHNAKPFESVQVGPGLNQGFKKEGSGGFNSALEARHRWQPKTVDQLRAKNNPKMSFKGQVLGAKGISERGKMGAMEKNRPDTFYIQSADRWLTTTGAGGEKQTSRAENILRDVNRINQVKEHFGGGANEGQATYQPGEYQPTMRPTLDPPIKHVSNATVKNGWKASSGSDYGKSGFSSLANARSLTGNNERMGNAFHATLTALAAPITDVLRPTRKQNVIGNARGAGNLVLLRKMLYGILTIDQKQLLKNKLKIHIVINQEVGQLMVVILPIHINLFTDKEILPLVLLLVILPQQKALVLDTQHIIVLMAQIKIIIKNKLVKLIDTMLVTIIL